MSEILGTAAVIIRPDTTKFRAELQAELAAATRGVVVPVEVAAVAGSTGAAAAATAATTGSTVALEENAVAAAVDGAALKKNAADAVHAAAAHEQLGRGAGASTLSLLGVRGATLAASGPFLIGAAAVTTAAKAVEAFSREQEAAARANKVFGDSAQTLEEDAKGLASQFGISATEALKFEGAIGEVFKTAGVASEANAKLSESLIKVAVDSAAFNNVPTAEVLRAIQLGLSGNLRGLRQFIPGVTSAEIALRALADSGKKTKESLTQLELTTARAEIIIEKAKNQSGSFADRQNNLAAQAKVAKANIENLAASLGGPLAHALTGDLILINKTIEGFGKLGDAAGHLGFFGPIVKSLITPLGVVKLGIDALTGSTKKATLSFDDFIHSVGLLGPAVPGLTGLTDEMRQAGVEADRLRLKLAFRVTVDFNQLDTLNSKLLEAQNNGATLQQQIGLAGGIVAKARKTAEDAQAALDKLQPGQKGFATAKKARDAADQALASAIAQQKGIQGQITSQAESAAAAAKSAADQAAAAARQAAADAQAQLDAQDQTLLTNQQIAQGNVEIAKARAANTKGLADDLAALRLELRVTNQQIAEAAKIHDANLRLQTIQALTLHSIQVQGQIAASVQAARDAARSKKVAAGDAAVEKARLDAEIATTLGHPNEAIAALRRENRALEAERKLWVGNTVKQKEITLEIARNNQQIKELQHQQDVNNNLGAELAFNFLQTQQGFAGTLLSNLLPTSATAGTVGGGAISTPSAPAPGPDRPLAGAAALSAAGAGGVTAGQGASQIDILRQILLVLKRIAAPQAHPEAHQQRSRSAAEMAHPV